MIVCLGAGAAAVACMELLIKCGAQREKIYMLDRKGVIHTRRDDINEYKQLFANNTDKRTLEDVIEGADIFLGVSGPDLLPPDALKLMADKPIVFACSNPDPEIKPELAHAVRDDLIMGTGRSDYPNQVNNVLCFPFIFRGALDVRASRINDEMKLAAVEAIRALAKEPVPASVLAAARVDKLEFGKEYIIPKPMDHACCHVLRKRLRLLRWSRALRASTCRKTTWRTKKRNSPRFFKHKKPANRLVFCWYSVSALTKSILFFVKLNAEFFHNPLHFSRDTVGFVFTDIIIRWQGLTGVGVQKCFAQQFTVGGMAQIVYLTAGTLISQDFQHFQRDRNGDLLDLLFLFTVLGVRVNIFAIPVCHCSPS